MGKTDNLTIRVEPDLKKRAELLREKYQKRIPMNIFLEIMLEYGMDVQDGILEYERKIYSKAVSERVLAHIEEKNWDETLSIVGDKERLEELEKKKERKAI